MGRLYEALSVGLRNVVGKIHIVVRDFNPWKN